MDATTQLSAPLPASVELCHEMIRTLLALIEKYEKRISRLEHGIHQLLRKRFGRQSERLEDIDPAQLLPFMKAYLEQLQAQEAAQTPAPAVKEKQAITYTRNKPARRNGFPEDLEREVVVHDLDEAQKQCGACGATLEKIGEEKSEQLDYVPAKLKVIVHIRPKYACKNKPCEGTMITADKARQPLEKGLAAAGLLAQIIVSKYVDHLPLHRQEQIFRRHDIDIARSTQCDWVLGVAELLQPLYRLMKTEVVRSRIIQTDDTPVEVQDKEHPQGIRQGRLWVYRGDDGHPYTVYDYTPDRSRAGPENFLREFKTGYLQADAYAGYDFIFTDPKRSVLEALCWAHARRKFYEAQKTALELSLTALAWITMLYQVEKESAKLEPEPKREARQQRSAPLLRDMESWLRGITDAQALPQSPFRQAVNYALNGWAALCRYTTDGELAIDNNACEQQMRPVALGRKNWLFFGSDRGGQAAAILLSLAQSAKRHQVNPWLYFKTIIHTISDTPVSQLTRLLPNNWAAKSN